MDDICLDQLRSLFAYQILWFREMKKKEATGEIDNSYIYDMCAYQFSNVSRRQWLFFLETISQD